MRYLKIITVSLSLAFLLGACGNGTGETAAYLIGGAVSGLEGSGLIIQNNGGDDLAITTDGTFTFSGPVADGAGYAVTVLTQPNTPTQTCSVSNGSGTVTGADVTNVTVACSDRYGSNDTCFSSYDLGTMTENSQALYSDMTLYPAGDDDWYRKHADAAVSDPTLCFLSPKDFTFAVTLTPPTGLDYELEVCYYDYFTTQFPCSSPPLCTSSTKPSDAVEVISINWAESCIDDDDRYFFVRVYPYQGAASRAPYSLDMSFQSQ